MGRASDGGGGWSPDGGSPDDLPDIPAEWGVIVIPDDLAELADEARAIRAELRLGAPRTPWQRFAARPLPRRLRRIGRALLRAPVLIISMAVLVTVASLFASAWPGPPRTPAVQRTAATTGTTEDVLPALELIGPDGQTVALRAQLPGVVVLTDGCRCDDLVARTVAAVRPGISVVTVFTTKASSAPSLPPSVLALRDPTDQLRTDLRLPKPDGTAAVLLVDAQAKIVRTLPRTASFDTVAPELARL